jgi:hypothetical protein
MSNRGGGLSLDMSISRNDEVMGSTFRKAGVSISTDHMVSFLVNILNQSTLHCLTSLSFTWFLSLSLLVSFDSDEISVCLGKTSR